jgi:crotonobetaine/carnitine-CoA ligase
LTGIFEAVRTQAERAPDKLALITEVDGDRSYIDLVNRSGRLAVSLLDGGLEFGTRVTVWMVNRPEYVEAVLALDAAGLSRVTLDPQWTDREMEYVLVHSGTQLIVTDDDHLDRSLGFCARIERLKGVVVVGRGTDAPKEVRFVEDMIGSGPADPTRYLPDIPDATEGGLSYTSGTTTGRPKAVVSGRGRGGAGPDYHAMWGITDRDRCITVSPFFHGNGLFGGTMYNLMMGASVVFPRRFSARRFWALVDRWRPSYMVSLVGLTNILMTLPVSPFEQSHSFRLWVVLGSAPLADAMEARYGIPVMDWYGMTEGGAGTCTRLDEPRRRGSTGRPFPGSTMTVLRADGSEAEPGEVGEVAFRPGGGAFSGYLDDTEATDGVIHDGWMWTGDIGYFDSDRYFFFVDRKKDIVRKGGENISTIEIESVLSLHPNVSEVAVIARPDPVLGERIAAFIVPRGDGPTLDELREFCTDYLTAVKLPDSVYPVAQLPRTGNGKVEKFRLRELLEVGHDLGVADLHS